MRALVLPTSLCLRKSLSLQHSQIIAHNCPLNVCVLLQNVESEAANAAAQDVSACTADWNARMAEIDTLTLESEGELRYQRCLVWCLNHLHMQSLHIRWISYITPLPCSLPNMCHNTTCRNQCHVTICGKVFINRNCVAFSWDLLSIDFPHLCGEAPIASKAAKLVAEAVAAPAWLIPSAGLVGTDRWTLIPVIKSNVVSLSWLLLMMLSIPPSHDMLELCCKACRFSALLFAWKTTHLLQQQVWLLLHMLWRCRTSAGLTFCD